MVALRSLACVLLVARLITGALNQREDTDRNNLYKNNGPYGSVGKLVTPPDCKSGALQALLVQVQPDPPAHNSAKASMSENLLDGLDIVQD